MYCTKCGAANPDGAAFCSKCGAGLPSAGTALVGATFRAGAAHRTSPSAADAAPGAAAFDEEAWRAAIGARNAAYYLPRLRAQHEAGRRALWHWPAFFISFYWLLYRKLWLAALAYLVLPYLLALVLAIGLQTAGAQHSAGGSVMWLLYLGAFFLGPPLAANSLYYAHTKRLIDRHRAGARSREQFLALLEAKGGTSNIAVVVIALLAVVFVVGILAAVAIPAYQDYTKRAKSSEAILAGMSVATQVSEQFARTGKIPSSLDEYRSGALLSKYVTDLRIDPKNGVIEMQVVFGPDAGGGKIYLIPEAKDGRAVTWSCRAEPAMARYVPPSCRGQ